MIFLFSLSGFIAADDLASTPTQIPSASTYTPEALEQLVAPIALYPDSLLASILMASTYPTEITGAENWLQDPQNAALQNEALDAALQQLPWDTSIKSLVPFHQVIEMLAQNIQWTEALGDAWLADQTDMMIAIQHLRQLAEDQGLLHSTSQQIVSTEDNGISIQPADPNMVYIPDYNPDAIYSDDNQESNELSFSVGVATFPIYRNWNRMDWHNNHININNPHSQTTSSTVVQATSNVWKHNPSHRGGVPYQSTVNTPHFQPVAAAIQNNHSARGYGPVNHTNPTMQLPSTAHASPPIFESQSQGAAAREHAAYGAMTRMHAPQNRVSQPNMKRK